MIPDTETLDTAFPDRYPRLDELLTHGGMSGVDYALVAGQNIGRFQKHGWSQIKDMPSLQIGQCDSVLLLGKGDPIPGASDQNGIRCFYADRDLPALTGIKILGAPLDQEFEATEADIEKAKSGNGPGAGTKKPRGNQSQAA